MAPRAPTPCRQRGCAGLSRDGSGYCTQHKAPSGWSDHKRGSNVDRGYGYAWQKLRKAVLHRDRTLCQACLSQMIFTRATDVDHIIPKHQGGTDSLDNLQSLCYPCHQAKTIKERGTVRSGQSIDVDDPMYLPW